MMSSPLSILLCMVLALSSTFALWAPQQKDWQLVKVISSEVAYDMAQVAYSANSKWSTLELNNRLLETMRHSLKTKESNIRVLYTSSENSSDMISRRLALEINQNQVLIDALTKTGKVEPRFIGALALGITQIVTDVTNMILRRY